MIEVTRVGAGTGLEVIRYACGGCEAPSAERTSDFGATVDPGVEMLARR